MTSPTRDRAHRVDTIKRFAEGHLSAGDFRELLYSDQRSVTCSSTSTDGRIRASQALAVQPRWLGIDGPLLQQAAREAGDRKGAELKRWLEVQNPAWPIGPNGPLVFLGQLSTGTYFHNAGYVYVFLDPSDGRCQTVIQVY